MSFVSLSFLLFLPLTFIAYWLLKNYWRWQNMIILIASYIFYGWWDCRFLLLILVTSFSSYWSGLYIENSRQPHQRKWMAGANIVLNLLILCFFKYFNFFAESLQNMADIFGWKLDMPTLQLILPVGISFYTFQSLSYTIDVYRRKIVATRDIVGFFAYISFFPQLVAGPIERATNLLPQMLTPRCFKYEEAVDGLRQILWGFFKKIVVADNCAIAVNMIWDSWQEQGAFALMLGMLLFSFQIYGDFSGYSDIAIGTAKLFGIRLSENFRLPYFSRTIQEFWRRWHISLMTWFRDYVYIPLGGSKKGRWVTLRNTFIVFFLSGLWHGANWTFVMWGVYNFALLVPAILSNRRIAKSANPPMGKDILPISITFVLVTIGWVMFRAPQVDDAFFYLMHFMNAVVRLQFGSIAMGKMAVVWCIVLILVEWLHRDKHHALQLDESIPRYARWIIYYFVLFCIFFFRGEEQMFIYFQF